VSSGGDSLSGLATQQFFIEGRRGIDVRNGKDYTEKAHGLMMTDAARALICRRQSAPARGTLVQ
jgi:hypothetical protein